MRKILFASVLAIILMPGYTFALKQKSGEANPKENPEFVRSHKSQFTYQLGIGAIVPPEGLLSPGYSGYAFRNELQYSFNRWFSAGVSLSLFADGVDKSVDIFYSPQYQYAHIDPDFLEIAPSSSQFQNLLSAGIYGYLNLVNSQSLNLYSGIGVCYNSYQVQGVYFELEPNNHIKSLAVSNSFYNLLDIGFQFGADVYITERLCTGLRLNFFLDDVGAAMMLNFGYRFEL